MGALVGLGAFLIPIVGAIALFSFLGVAAWSDARRKEREAYYKAETLRKIAESSGEGAKSALELMREEEKSHDRRQREGQRLGGMITAAVGIGVMVFLHGIEHEEPVYLAGLIPLLIGVALLANSLFFSKKELAP